MAKKKEDKVITEIKELVKKGKIVIGLNTTLKHLRKNKLKSIYISSNCPKKVKEDLYYYSKIAKVEVIALPYQNDELGVMCKKPFSISVIGVKV